MSITKNTPRRKKLAPPDAGSASQLQPQAKPLFPAAYVEHDADLGLVYEAQLDQFILNLPLVELRPYAGRFYALMEALDTARQLPSPITRRALVKLIASLENESRYPPYRQLLQAIAEAAQSQAGLSRAYSTAAQLVEMAFQWTSEYLFAFGLYKRQLKQARQAADPDGGATARRPVKEHSRWTAESNS